MNIPCENCLTLPICMNIGYKTNGVSYLAMEKCDDLLNFLTSNHDLYEFDIEKMYAVFDFMRNKGEGKDA